MQIDLRCHITFQPASPPDPRIAALVSAVQALTGNVTTMSANVSEALATLTANVQRLADTEAAVEAFVKGIPALVQAAVDEAIAKGATPEQLAAFDELNTRLASETDELTAAITTPPSA